MLRERARIIRQVRSFFDTRGYLELDTPLLSPDLIPESCLEVFETNLIRPSGEKKPYWLIPSPEIWMKKIIAAHRVSVYQICKCFRNGESTGFLHSPEFTMLEYYTMDAGYEDSLKITEDLFAFLSQGSGIRDQGSGVDVRKHSGLVTRTDNEQNPQSLIPIPHSPFLIPHSSLLTPFTRLTIAEAFARYANFDLFAAAEKPGGLEAEARRLGLEPPACLKHQAGRETAALYDLIFIHAVEPHLRQERPVALLDYPAFVPTLARQGPVGKTGGGKTVERWELYFNGIELANCFTEETDAGRVRDFFESEATAKERHALIKHKVDGDYWKIFQSDPPFPRCSGVALGLDRFIMALCGRSTIDSVLPFSMAPFPVK